MVLATVDQENVLRKTKIEEGRKNTSENLWQCCNNRAIPSIMVLLCCLINAMIHRGMPSGCPGPAVTIICQALAGAWPLTPSVARGTNNHLGSGTWCQALVPVYLGVNSKIEHCDNAMRCPKVRNF